MKKLLFLLLSLVSLTAFAQEPKIRLADDSTKVDIAGGVIDKGDEFIVNVQLNGNGNTTSRSLYFDFEFQNTAFDFINVTNTGTGGNGGVLPGGASITMDNYTYLGYSFAGNGNNTSPNGNQNYNNAGYSFTQGGPKTIIRVYLNWATNSPLPYNTFGDLLKLRFRLKTTAVGDAWDPIKMNFAASFNQNGSSGAAINEIPLTTVITQNPDAKKFVKAVLDLNGNINPTHVKVLFKKADNTGPMFNVTANGTVNIVDSLLTANTSYQIMVMANMDQLPGIMNSAVSVSDYTTAQAEFVSQNLDRTYKNTSIVTGMGYWAVDVNRSNGFDGGDLTKLYAQAVGVNQLIVLPEGYTVGSNGWMSLPTFKASEFDAATPSNVFTALPTNAQRVYEYTTPATPGTPLTINVKYVLPGDINRSHSSQVVINGAVATNAIVALNKSIANKLYAAGPIMNRTESFINTPQKVASIDVNIKNVTVTSNSIEIPVAVNTNGNEVAALQFEFAYDPSKVKFESMASEVPNEWYVFANSATGKVKFGAIDQKLKTPIKGAAIPFKLKFSTLVSGLDINSFIKITSATDAASTNGSQLGINLNTETIKLTGYNNF
jgi:hypothetical protein